MELQPLLQTKLFVPPLRGDLVARPHLIERLDAGLEDGLTLVSAPAGFGKTTLVGEWVQALSGAPTPVAIAWLSLDEDDNEGSRFLAYLIAALRTTDPSLAQGAWGALQSPQPPPAKAILTSLLNEMAALSDRTALILDDYHVIEAQPIHDALRYLLEHLPPQMHLVIATREDPPLPLARLRARGQLTELRAQDLRFTSSEAADFLNRVRGLQLSLEDVAALESRTEGWIAGLQLAALSMQGRDDTPRLVRAFTGSHRHVLDYLVKEVLDQQPERVQRFLLQTSILDRLTGSLCDAVRFGCAETPSSSEGIALSGQAILEALDRANLFIVPLDNERHWYRYHHLFADLLRQRAAQHKREEMPALHRRASEWYAQQDLPPDAIRHALAAGNAPRAADLAELAWPAWSTTFRSITWLGWVRGLPEDLVRARPVLSLAYARAFLNAGQLEEAESKLKDVERWLDSIEAMGEQPAAAPRVAVDDEQFRALPASLATARAYHAQAIGDLSGTARYVQRALDLLPEEDEYNRAAVRGLLGLAYWANGDLEAAHRTFTEGLFQNVHDRITGTFVLADMELALGQLREAERTCMRGLQLAKEYHEPMPLGTEDVYSALSEVHREQGDLAGAAQALSRSKELGEQVELPDWQHRWCIAQARLQETLGNLDAALELLEEAERLFVRTPVPDIRPIAAMKARVWVRQGRLAEALAWAHERDVSAEQELSYLREFEHMILARLLIAQYPGQEVDDAIAEATGLLERLLQAAEEGKRMGSVLHILALLALAHAEQGRLRPALAHLERALALAEPEGYIQVFVDEGPPMARLLYAALAREIAPDLIRRLLAAFPAAGPEPAAPPVAQAAPVELLEPLSEREVEVLRLLAEGLSNREIAARLFLALNTVKAHNRNIYGKLGVRNRTHAVARARALGILHQA